MERRTDNVPVPQADTLNVSACVPPCRHPVIASSVDRGPREGLVYDNHSWLRTAFVSVNYFDWIRMSFTSKASQNI